MKGKMNLPLKEFLTLVGPAQVLHIIEEGETEPAFKDRSVKIRDHEELLDREVKFIQPAAEEPAKKKRRRRATDPKTGLTVFEPNTVYFNDYLETYIGAKWQAIKNSLYDAGYQALEVSRYRDGLLDDFNRICAENNYHGIV